MNWEYPKNNPFLIPITIGRLIIFVQVFLRNTSLKPPVKYEAFLFLVIFGILVVSCHLTKYVPEGQYLLAKSKIDVDNKDINKKELKLYLKQRPNARILGFWKFHLWLYNLSNPKKEDGWLKRIGEPPVIYSEYQTMKSVDEFTRYLHNKGYYRASVTDTVIFKNSKADVYYKIISNQPYLIDSFKAVILDDSVKDVLPYDSVKTLVPKNSRFDSDMLAAKSNRIVRYLQNNGFYKEDKNAIYFEADTFRTKERAELKMIIDKENVVTPDTSYLKDHQRYTFRNFYYYIDVDALRRTFTQDTADLTKRRTDTLKLDNQYFIYSGLMRFRPELLMNSNHIADKKFYSLELVERTYNELYALHLFKIINIRFNETHEKDSLGYPTLDCMINVTPSLRQAFTISAEGTNALGNFGIEGNLGYQHKNIFRGGELLDVTLLGALERQSYGVGDSTNKFNSFETGIDTKLTLPKYLAPIKTKRLFRYSVPQTLTELAYNYQRRPDYTRTIFRASFGYQWKTSDYNMHRFNILDLNMIKMFSYNPEFISRIENLSIRSSYTDHSISAWNYIYTYSTLNYQKRTKYKYIRATAETAGNLLYGFNKLFNRHAYTSDTLSGAKYHFLGTPFAQYFKTDLEFHKGIVIDKYNMVAFRVFGGIAVPYGNSDQVPFERKYFTGGANGIRAWPIRTLGPGTYKADPNEFPNETGDIKLEANAEYRFAIIGDFEGAFFVDMGNIWSLKDNRPGTEFRLNRFYKDIAIGPGFGVRYDFSYVILRVDMGFKLHDPSIQEGSRWIPLSSFFNKNNYNICFAVGYPF